MLKYFKWFKRNAGKTRKSYNSETGHTRNTQSRKTTKAQTISRSNNSNGTIRETKTWRRPDGLWKRTVKTTGSKPSPVRKPKFIKAKPYKPPKLRKIRKPKASRYYNSSRKSEPSFFSLSEGTYDPEQERMDKEKHIDRVFTILSYIIRPTEGPKPWYKRLLTKILFEIIDTLVYLYELVVVLLWLGFYYLMLCLGGLTLIFLFVWLVK